MKLKAIYRKWSAGRPIVILNEKDAKKIGAEVNNRVVIKHKSKIIIALVNTSRKIAKEGDAVLTTEVKEALNFADGQIIDVELAKNPRITQIITKKLSGKELSKSEITKIISEIVKNALTETEIAFFISAVYKVGMSLNETKWLTEAMLETGKQLDIKRKIIADKHCIGGIAGNRTTPIVVSICAAEGITIPKSSSRAITSAAGTADVMESICRVEFDAEEIKRIILKTNACLVWGGALGFAPADDKIIKVEKMINIDPEPNLIASILAKKLAVRSNHVLIDIPYGTSAKVNKKGAEKLKKTFEKLGKMFKIKLKCVLTDGNQPIGNGIGPILEMRDVISVLKGDGPHDLREKSIFLAGKIFELCNMAEKNKGGILAKEILDSGKAFKKFEQIVKAQGAKGSLMDKLSYAKFYININSKKSGIIKSIDNKKINLLARIAGSPDDKKAGVYLWKHAENKIQTREKIITIYSQSKKRLEDAVSFYKENEIIGVVRNPNQKV